MIGSSSFLCIRCAGETVEVGINCVPGRTKQRRSLTGSWPQDVWKDVKNSRAVISPLPFCSTNCQGPAEPGAPDAGLLQICLLGAGHLCAGGLGQGSPWDLWSCRLPHHNLVTLSRSKSEGYWPLWSAVCDHRWGADMSRVVGDCWGRIHLDSLDFQIDSCLAGYHHWCSDWGSFWRWQAAESLTWCQVAQWIEVVFHLATEMGGA